MFARKLGTRDRNLRQRDVAGRRYTTVDALLHGGFSFLSQRNLSLGERQLVLRLDDRDESLRRLCGEIEAAPRDGVFLARDLGQSALLARCALAAQFEDLAKAQGRFGATGVRDSTGAAAVL